VLYQFIFEGPQNVASAHSMTPSNKISAFLFAGLIFFVTFLHQGKKVKAFYLEGNLTYILLEGVK
jgi:hypothetical protein